MEGRFLFLEYEASLRFADYETTSQQDNEWRLRWGYANASPESRNYGSTELRRASLGLRKATPDNKTTSQQDNEWRLRKAAPDDYVDL